MKKCSKCHKNIAMLFASTVEDGKPSMQGLCLECAKKMQIPGIDELIRQTGMSADEITTMTSQFSQMAQDEEEENDFLLGDEEVDEDSETPASEVEDTEPAKDKSSSKRGHSRKQLSKYAVNLNQRAAKGNIDKMIGREDEMQRMIQILNRRSKNNPILVGEPGVGKTAIAEGLARRIVEQKVPAKLRAKEVWLLDMTAVVAGTQFRGQFESRMKAILEEAASAGTVILVIDEVHNIMGAGEVHGGTMNAANILKPALARGEIQLIGATTLEEYRKYIEKDGALERRFQPVRVEEPSASETVKILQGIKHYYEDFHQIQISDEVIQAAVELSERYLPERFLPDKAIDLIDEAGSAVNLHNTSLEQIQRLQKDLSTISAFYEEAQNRQDFEEAARHKSEMLRLEEKISHSRTQALRPLAVGDIAQVLRLWTGLPVENITQDESVKLLALEERLHARLIGQEPAVEAVAKAVRRHRSGFWQSKRPASFIFVGPTGVGKTELVKALAFEMFGSEKDLIRLDMSEYMEKHTVSKMVGSPPGYVGYEEGGQLTEKVRRRPYSVILLDEIEKAHPDVFNMLLQILEDGRLTDAAGKTVHFENTILIMTSNAGTGHKAQSLGFSSSALSYDPEKTKEALKEVFRPEFLNRVDEVVVFEPLQKEQMRQIVDLRLREVRRDVRKRGIAIQFTDEVKAFLLEKGFDAKYGARPLRRVITRYIEDEISELYLRQKVSAKDQLQAVMIGPVLAIEKISP